LGVFFKAFLIAAYDWLLRVGRKMASFWRKGKGCFCSHIILGRVPEGTDWLPHPVHKLKFLNFFGL
jgi:hypothetical protein